MPASDARLPRASQETLKLAAVNVAMGKAFGADETRAAVTGQIQRSTVAASVARPNEPPPRAMRVHAHTIE